MDLFSMKGHLSKKILAQILLVSSFVTLIITSVQVAYDYSQGKKDISFYVNETIQNHYNTIVYGAWNFDTRSLLIILRSLEKSADISYANIKEHNVSVGDRDRTVDKIIKREIFYEISPDKKHYLGVLELGISYTNLYSKLRKKVFVILITQGVKTFFVSFFILFLVRKTVIYPLYQMTKYLEDHNHLKEDWKLEVEPEHKNDEIGMIQGQLKTTVSDMKTYHDKLNTINQNLDKIIFEKTQEIQIQTEAMQESKVQKEKILTIGRMVAGVSHEIRNPLNSLYNFHKYFKEMEEFESILLNESDEQKIKDYYQKAKMRWKKAISIVKRNTSRIVEILDTMDMLKQGLMTQKEKVNLKEYLSEEFNDLLIAQKYKIADKNSLVFTAEDIGFVMIGKKEFSYLLKEIFKNSIEAIQEKSKKSSREYLPKFKLTVKKQDNKIILNFYDNGIGMNEDLQSKMVEPFFTTKSPSLHRGLGYTVSSNILQVMGGDIIVDSLEGEFTLIKVTLTEVDEHIDTLMLN
jgi:C4-dicarboxylate-specific signal transduction histidine kinase